MLVTCAQVGVGSSTSREVAGLLSMGKFDKGYPIFKRFRFPISAIHPFVTVRRIIQSQRTLFMCLPGFFSRLFAALLQHVVVNFSFRCNQTFNEVVPRRQDDECWDELKIDTTSKRGKGAPCKSHSRGTSSYLNALPCGPAKEECNPFISIGNL